MAKYYNPRILQVLGLFIACRSSLPIERLVRFCRIQQWSPRLDETLYCVLVRQQSAQQHAPLQIKLQFVPDRRFTSSYRPSIQSSLRPPSLQIAKCRSRILISLILTLNQGLHHSIQRYAYYDTSWDRLNQQVMIKRSFWDARMNQLRRLQSGPQSAFQGPMDASLLY